MARHARYDRKTALEKAVGLFWEKGYHGTNFGGISVGGMVNNRKFFGPLLAGVDHLPATYVREHQRFSRGEPEWGAHLADDLERLCALHDPSTIAAVRSA